MRLVRGREYQDCSCADLADTMQVSVEVPDQKGRLSILKVHAKNKKLSEEVELAQVAMRTPGFSGADLANLLNEVIPPTLLTLRMRNSRNM